MQKPIVVVGSINLDLVASTERIPQVGETVIGRTFTTFFGGKGANQAVAVARLGYPVSMVGNVGNDAFGTQLRNGLAEAGVNTEYVGTVEGSSGTALIITGPNGENSIVVVPGANAQLTPKSIEQATPVLKQAGFILVQLEIPLETVEYLAEYAERHDIPLMLDPAPARELPVSLLRRVSWLTPNETETRELLKSNFDEDDQASYAAADQLLSRGVKNVVLKLGTRGCVIAQGSQPHQNIPAFSVNAVDTTAAGDAFNAGFAVGLISRYSAFESGVFASAVAGLSVTRPGAQPSMPRGDEVEKFLQERQR
ncbi:MAG TPA: ribokinase [Terriglobales bacterium]